MMYKQRKLELGKSRAAQIRMADVCSGILIGTLAVWIIWLSSSLLLRFIR